MSAYIAPGLIPEVRRVIISDKIITQQLSRKPLIKTVYKTRAYKTYFVKDKKDYGRAYRTENATKMGERSKLGMRKLRARIKLGIVETNN